MSELKGPSFFEIKRLIEDKKKVEFYTLNNQTFKGQILWNDDNCFHISLEDNTEITLFKVNLTGYKIV